METDEGELFYVGYRKKAPAGLAKVVRRGVFVLGVVITVTAVAIGGMQSPIDHGAFEFGTYRAFEGVLYETPVPMLRMKVRDPNGAGGEPAVANLVLVGYGKAGLPEFARGHDGRKVRFTGSLIHRENMTMVEMNDRASFQVLGEPTADEQRTRSETIGPVTLTGELVDTKCFLGVMRPATGKVHRACAIRCLSGGVPPGLLVRDEQGNGVVFMLAGKDNQPLDYDVQLAALTVRVSGLLEMHDGVPVVRTGAVVQVSARDGKE